MKISTNLQDLQDLHFYKSLNIQDLQTYKPKFIPSTGWWPRTGRGTRIFAGASLSHCMWQRPLLGPHVQTCLIPHGTHARGLTRWTLSMRWRANCRKCKAKTRGCRRSAELLIQNSKSNIEFAWIQRSISCPWSNLWIQMTTRITSYICVKPITQAHAYTNAYARTRTRRQVDKQASERDKIMKTNKDSELLKDTCGDDYLRVR